MILEDEQAIEHGLEIGLGSDDFVRSGGDSQLGDNVLSTEERKMPK
jgi:hypothetical protein